MKQIALAVVVLMSTSAPMAANAAGNVGSVGRATCASVVIDHPDGTQDSETRCHTDADGTR